MSKSILDRLISARFGGALQSPDRRVSDSARADLIRCGFATAVALPPDGPARTTSEREIGCPTPPVQSTTIVGPASPGSQTAEMIAAASSPSV
jgi:hypothetical protein